MRRRTTGFTLIELLIVVAVMAILFSILIVPLTKARRFAMLATCKSNLRTLHGGNLNYMQNNDWRKPEFWAENNGPASFIGTITKKFGEPVGQGRVLEFIGSSINPLICPAVTLKGDNEADREAWDNSDYAGSSYLYEWFNPGTQSRSSGDFDSWLESLRFTNEAGTKALILDLNFEDIGGGDEYLSHKYVRKVNVLHNDGAVIGYDYETGLLGQRWSLNDILDMMENAHSLRGVHDE